MIVPYSPEWWEARRGKITASSRLHTALYGSLREKNAMLDEMELELLAPITQGEPNKYQAWGHKQEKHAKFLIECLYDVDTVEPGLVFHPEVPILAATPDYVTSDPGASVIAGEIKCPYYLKRHMQLYMLGVRSPMLDDYMQKYITQVQGQMLITGASVGWFSSYHPDAEAEHRLSREVIAPDAELHERMLAACNQLASMLQSDSRYGVGRTKRDGVTQVF